MKRLMILSATLAAATLAGVAISASANAAPAADRDYIERAVPSSSNPHDVFKRIVKVPRTPATAEAHDGSMMRGHAAMRAACDCMAGEHRGAAPAPKG